MENFISEGASITPLPLVLDEIVEALPPTVAAIGELPITGNLIPGSWYQHLKLRSGLTDLVGCTLLAEIVYQYRPRVERDTRTGEVLRYVKRFARDRFCAPLAYFQGKFAFTKDQVRQALKRLESAGLIVREYRTITVAGKAIHGMTFVEPVPAAIAAITANATAVPPANAWPGAIDASGRTRHRSEDTVSNPQPVVSTPGGVDQKPLYKDSSQIPPDLKTPTPPTSPENASQNQRNGSRRRSSNKCVVIASYDQPTSPSQPEILPSPSDIPLQFDFHLASLSEAERTLFRRRLARLPLPLAQRVLDEYNSAVGRGATFRNRWGWIEYLIRKAQRGEFIPTAELAEQRLKVLDPIPSEAPLAVTPSRTPSLVWRTHRQVLQTHVSSADFTTYVLPLRGIEEGDTLWLEAPNAYAIDWVRAHWALFEQALKPHTLLTLRVRLEAD